jgi:site-specific DNA-methyltransferase (adenine-specific)
VTISLLLGDCREELKTLSDCSVDAVVTDPPYEMGFMRKAWDETGVSYDLSMWREVLRVVKPGAHLLSFGGTRTYHRMASAIEDAGFEIRDQLQWLYGSGFPKSLDVKKAIEKGDASDKAELWAGWGTGLKPANEPICLARKPLSERTVALNVLSHGTGAINLDAARIEGEGDVELTKKYWSVRNAPPRSNVIFGTDKRERRDGPLAPHPDGRFPSNLLLDEEAAALIEKQLSGASRFFYTAKAGKAERERGLRSRSPQKVNDGRHAPVDTPFQRGDTKRLNTHPTVKPIPLMSYLVQLITPPGGTVLDPFMGSGATILAAREAGFSAIGIEIDPDYFEIAKAKLENIPEQGTLF